MSQNNVKKEIISFEQKAIKKTAILVDGGFYRKIAHKEWGDKTPAERANELEAYCRKHLKHKYEQRQLYRIFYYDCLPSDKSIYNPITQKNVELRKSDMYGWMNDFIQELKSKRKFAIRLGTLSTERLEYRLKSEPFKKLCKGSISVDDLTDNDMELHIVQKGVDMKIGIDIASLAYKRQVDQIIFISGDSDFVPAAKLARREGIDFILDHMGQHIKPDLNEHIDGIQTHVRYKKEAVGTVV